MDQHKINVLKMVWLYAVIAFGLTYLSWKYIFSLGTINSSNIFPFLDLFVFFMGSIWIINTAIMISKRERK